jgi:hypothetical protein
MWQSLKVGAFMTRLARVGDGQCKAHGSALVQRFGLIKICGPTYLDRAEALAHTGQLELAVRDCDTAAHLQPDFYRTFIIRATVFAAFLAMSESVG